MFPSEIRANFDLSIVLEGYAGQVADGYTPKLILGGAASLTKDGTVIGDDIVFSLLATDTAALVTGQYWYQVVTEDGGTGRSFVLDGSVLIRGTITGSGTYDGRSVAQQILDAIDATILNKATADQQSYVIQSGSGSRSLSRIPLPELKEIRAIYASIVAGEIRNTTESPLFKRHPFTFVIGGREPLINQN